MLNAIIHFSIKNKIVIALMTLALVIWGLWSATKLPIDAVPDITNNQVQIITICPTLAGQEVEQFVTYPIEKALANLPDVEELRSISRFGLSVVTVVFDDKVNVWFARQLVGEKMREAEEQIPPGIGKPELAPVSTGLGEIYQYVIHPKKGSEDKYDAMDLRTMQDWIVARQLYGTPGVAEVNSFGGILKQYEVAVSPRPSTGDECHHPRNLPCAPKQQREHRWGLHRQKAQRLVYTGYRPGHLSGGRAKDRRKNWRQWNTNTGR